MIDLLVFFHGLDRCRPRFVPDPKKTRNKFGLDEQIDASGRKVALAVPVIHWDANVGGLWTAANLNKFVEEVRGEIGRQSGVTPTLGRLIIAGHSKAYAILTPLALEFVNNAAATKQGALAKLKEVWALDSTYGLAHVSALDRWAHAVSNGRFIALLNRASLGDCTQLFLAQALLPGSGRRESANRRLCESRVLQQEEKCEIL